MSIQFANANTSRVKVTNPNVLQPIDQNKQFTIACWVNPITLVNNSFLVVLGPSTNIIELTISGTAGAFQCKGNPFNGNANSTAGFLTAGSWQHIAATYNGNTDQLIRLYANGVEVTYAVQTAAAYPTTPLYPNGITLGGNPNISNNFNGRLAEVAVFNVALTAQQISQIAASTIGLSVGSPGWKNLVAYYHLSGQTTVEIDSTGNYANGGVVTNCSYFTDSPGYSFTAGQPVAPATTVNQQFQGSLYTTPGTADPLPSNAGQPITVVGGTVEGRFDVNTVINNPG